MGSLIDRHAWEQSVDAWLVRLEQRISTARVGHLVASWLGERIPNHGQRVRTDAPGVSPQAKASILFHLYERREITLLRRYLRADLDVLEAGASLGVTGMVASSRLAAGRRLIALEPNPQLIPVLTQNLNTARPGHTAVVHGALAYPRRANQQRRASATFVPGPDSVLGAVVGDGGAGEPVPAFSLEALRRTGGIDRYALVCDIEGGEWELIRQPEGVFAGCEQLFIELHPLPDEPDVGELLKRLIDVHQFRHVAHRGPVHFLALDGTPARLPARSDAWRGIAPVVAAGGLAALSTWIWRRRHRGQT